MRQPLRQFHHLTWYMLRVLDCALVARKQVIVLCRLLSTQIRSDNTRELEYFGEVQIIRICFPVSHAKLDLLHPSYNLASHLRDEKHALACAQARYAGSQQSCD